MFHVKNAIALTMSITSIVCGQSTRTTWASSAAFAAAQEQGSTADESKKHALRVFDELLEAANLFVDPEVRIIVQARIANLLWEHDPSRARSLITAAFYATAEIQRSPYEAREEMVGIISRRDVPLALELVEMAVDRPPNDDPKYWDTGYGRYSQQAMLYRRLAGDAGTSDPALVARIARMFIDKGHLEFGLAAVRSLPAANGDLARDLLAQAFAVAVTRRNSERVVWNIDSLAGFMFPTFSNGTFRFPAADRDSRSAQPAHPELIQPFLEFAYDVITERIRSPRPSDGDHSQAGPYLTNDLSVARSMLPFFEQYMPDKAAILGPRLTEAVRVANASVRPNGDTGAAVRLLTVQEMLEAAKRTQSASERNQLYYEAAYRTMISRQLAQAREIAGKITHVPARDLIARFIQRAEEAKRLEAVMDAVFRRDFDNSYRLINELPDPRVRAQQLGHLAYAMIERKETARAARVIGEAQRLILTTDISMVRAREQLKLAAIAAPVDLDRGFDDLRAAVVTINSANIPTQWTKITSGDLFESREGGLGFLVSGLDEGFTIFGDADFERALQVARGIEMKEVSVLAQLAVCRGALKGYRL